MTRVVSGLAPTRSDTSMGMFGVMAQTPRYLDTLDVVGKLPFQLPETSWLNWGIGKTPMVQVEERIHAKLEGESPGGSLKDRTITALVLNAFADGRLRAKGDTLLLVTSGSAGYSLVKVKQALEAVRGCELDVVVAMPKAYAHKEVPANIIDLDGVRTFEGCDALLEDMQSSPKGQARVLLLDGVFMDVLAESKELAQDKGWMLVDQHFDAHAVTGHHSTAAEIMLQCPDVTDVVCATGTGATAAGLLRYLPAHVKVHSRPAVSGSIDGLSNLERYDNFCDQSMLEGYSNGFFNQDIAQDMQKDLVNNLGMACGPSTGATYGLAKDIIAKDASAKVVFIAADGKRPQQPDSRASFEDLAPLATLPFSFSEGMQTPAVARA
jgi:cysteine synthase